MNIANNSLIEKNNEIEKNSNKTKFILNLSTVLGFMIIGIFILYGMHKGIFSSSETFNNYIVKLGVSGIVVFIAIQAIQVIIPILPGAIGCGVGIIAFGPVLGFIYNYIGICIGSIIAFIISKRYGLPLIKKIVNSKSLDKYMSLLDKRKKFDTLFAISIFAPIAPDDLLCFLAGLTKMSLKKFILIILLCKPFSISLYSIGLAGILSMIGL